MLSYPEWKAHEPYCYLWSVRLYCTFHRLSRTRHNIRKKVIDHKMRVMSLSKMFVCNTSHSKKKWKNIIKNIYCSSSKVPVILVRLKKNLNFLERLSKNSNIKFHKNQSSGTPVVLCGTTDEQIWLANSRFLFNFANAPKKLNRKHALLRVF
jgi:intracellular sulfur oxidation DsrE/DsrF family protein